MVINTHKYIFKWLEGLSFKPFYFIKQLQIMTLPFFDISKFSKKTLYFFPYTKHNRKKERRSET